MALSMIEGAEADALIAPATQSSSTPAAARARHSRSSAGRSAHRLAERLGPAAVIVTLAVDSGFEYLSVAPYADS